MPHSKDYIPTARNISSRKPSTSSTVANDRLPTAPKSVYHTAGKRRKANSAPPVLVNGRVYSRYGSQDNVRSNEFNSSYTSDVVKNQSVTSRCTSPCSSFSGTDTLAHFSDSSSVTATEAASPKSINSSVASRRYKFKEEFGTENAVAASANVYTTPAKHVERIDPINAYTTPVEHTNPVNPVYGHQSVAPPHSHERTTGRAAKQKKTKARKKTSRSCAPNLDFAYRNVCTAATGIGNVASPASAKGKGGRDIFEGPNVATAHVGCVVM
ncbi:hypothetical protein MMC30_001178 [Trapelia coarctata]|nr:hypothetical protein [Trapelia coarctata]